jgi:transcriptional regulator with GAF, ATPase, and Fis domain
MLLETGNQPGNPVENWRVCFPEIIGRSPAMMAALETAAKVARSDSSVLIMGESGSGKELFAAAIHRLSHRSPQPYIPLNCAAIPENLLESELFGHEKGAFTGADKRRIGKFEAATKGTLFLDEIGDMPLALQAKLLRVLQDKKFAPLGGNDLKEADVRVIAATHMNLEQAVSKKSFREDLFYRLNVLPLYVPSLRERVEDIPQLLEHFTEITNANHAAVSTSFFTDATIRILCRYSWPGNVRQLQNLVERLVVLKGGGAISVDDIPADILRAIDLQKEPAAHLPASEAPAQFEPAKSLMPLAIGGRKQVAVPDQFGVLPETGIDLTTFIEELENGLILQALERTNNNRNQAAKLLGLNRTTLVERIKKRRLAVLNEPSKEL